MCSHFGPYLHSVYYYISLIHGHINLKIKVLKQKVGKYNWLSRNEDTLERYLRFLIYQIVEKMKLKK